MALLSFPLKLCTIKVTKIGHLQASKSFIPVHWTNQLNSVSPTGVLLCCPDSPIAALPLLSFSTSDPVGGSGIVACLPVTDKAILLQANSVSGLPRSGQARDRQKLENWKEKPSGKSFFKDKEQSNETECCKSYLGNKNNLWAMVFFPIYSQGLFEYSWPEEFCLNWKTVKISKYLGRVIIGVPLSELRTTTANDDGH